MVGYARNLLEGKGFTLDVASDGEAAMVAYMTRRPDLILLDVFVPRIDGLRFARAAARALSRSTACRSWCGRAPTSRSRSAICSTRRTCLHKPAASDELLEVVRRALGRRDQERGRCACSWCRQSVAALRALVEELRADSTCNGVALGEALALFDVRPYEAVVVDMAEGAGGIAERDGAGILRRCTRATATPRGWR